MANSDKIIQVHKDYEESVNKWEFYIRSYNGGFDYAAGQYLHRYNLELDNEYAKRLSNTALDNHCKNIVQIYSSFLFRVKPSRDFGNLDGDPMLELFLKDADLDGNSFNNVIAQAQNYASIYGHCFLMLDKPNFTTQTMAQELDAEVRPYLSIVTPENVFDWHYQRQVNGRYILDYLKIREEVDSEGGTYFRIWYTDKIETIYVKSDYDDPKMIDSVPNRLGKIPSVTLFNSKSHKRGIGMSDLTDIADLQKSIYNEYSEIEQTIHH